ncbi:hypothetical protein CTAYLR_000824 [Chrysophaeum taylorii]|uniref:Uncharacterized protein n=1 Tax=Chrysophaeum taylorii TaxID=2483200 RepID=A0AAD7XS62_9STRA|nr:hypothetical protein CTAYLR_000824 [Chrysophaeum taylorii]
MVAAFRRVGAILRGSPVLTSMGVTGAKAFLADAMVQRIWEKREALDLKRSVVFGSFGCLYQGLFQYFAFNHVLEGAFPGVRPRVVLIKVALTNAILDPCFFFPSFYSLKEALAAQRLDAAVVMAALDEYHSNYMNDWLNSWAVWLPAHAITYGVIPIEWRIPWVAAVSFGYVCILSSTRGEVSRTIR